MKRKIILILVSLGLSVVILLLSYTPREYFYYKDTSNYTELTGDIDSVKYYEDGDVIVTFATLSEKLSVPVERLAFSFLLNKGNEEEMNAVRDVLQVGNAIAFITAPRYFGDGYNVPIVSISFNGKEIVTFDDGYSRLVHDRFVRFCRLIVCLVLFVVIVNVAALVLFRKKSH